MRDLLLYAGAAILLLLIIRGWRGKTSFPETPPNDMWFQSEVMDESRSRPVVVKFGAGWCGPCRAMEPELDDLESALGDSIHVVRIDIDERRELSDHYNIGGIPHTLVFFDGKVVADRVGLRKSGEMQALVRGWVQ